jgi:hypothetical protein
VHDDAVNQTAASMIMSSVVAANTQKPRQPVTQPLASPPANADVLSVPAASARASVTLVSEF